jgi:glycosyltransferase involved in cell wall biosynthesis
MTILVFFPSNQIAVDQQSSMWLFKQMGHKLIFLSLQEKGALHAFLENVGIETYGGFDIPKHNSLQYYVSIAGTLHSFCKKKKIDIVIAHLQACIFSAILCSFFTKIKLITYRHYSDNAFLSNNKKEILLDKIINSLAKHIIVPSQKVMNHMLTIEKVKPSKLHLIPYGYNFDFYPKPNELEVSAIKERCQSDILFCTIARLVPLKRHALSIQALAQIRNQGINASILFVGAGPEHDNLLALVKKYKLENAVYFEGFKTNVFDYLAACDCMLLLSNTEASNNAVKEAAHLGKTVMICKDVGDFDDYVEHEISGFVLQKENPVNEMIHFSQQIAEQKFNLMQMGENLQNRVKNMFAIEPQKADYEKLFNKVYAK